ncbi:Nn.00g034330.m01.CDS01 [Neocucurbitaria sp. VM-36]
MGVANPPVDPANIVQALVYTLLDVFDATRDLYQTLEIKEKRDYQEVLRSKGYPTSRKIEYVDDGRLGSDEALIMDKAAVTRQFEIGYQALGTEFAVGDVLSQTALQSQIIALQSVLVTTFLYGPTSSDPISHQLSNLNAASRAAGEASVDILATQQRRQQNALSPTPRSTHSPIARSCPTYALPYPETATGTSSTSTALVKHHQPSRLRSSSPVNTTVLEWRGRPKPERTDTDTTSMTGPTSYGMKSASHDLYCLYAIDLQRHPTQPLSASITSDPVPSCPHCQQTLHLSSGRAWEILKEDDGYERCFQVSNRFVVKCHRDGPDGQYSCVICSKYASVDTVCGDVKALIKHIWEDHDIRDLKHEEDIVEIIEQPAASRRDSGYGASRISRRSTSLGSSRRRRSMPASEREVEKFEIRSSRWGA